MLRRAILTLALLPLFAQAQFTGPGSNVANTVNTVVAAQSAADDTPVLLEGHIVRKIKNEHYEFKDATGSIEVEIDQKYLPAQQFDHTNKVRLRGEVDASLLSRNIDVKSVEILP
ncbi:NirD/YgiW/YdeI family stress tolerance protein [Deefgea rivuli]|uniref:NirD/YgiW/YdeI family stress tolerance protein n=1 Tax=Deefgea rivuli TaxID=400948 RepID=UPI000487BAA7|nr:NirD/YgiW/YdeI family stress tolerance protein [Deefgea rivuli]